MVAQDFAPAWLRYLEGEEDTDVMELMEDADDIIMAIYGEGYPEVRIPASVIRRIDQHKHIIIKSILRFIKENSDEELMDEVPMATVNVLEAYGVRWPELEVIKQSLVAKNPELEEDTLGADHGEMAGAISSMEDGKFSKALFLIMEIDHPKPITRAAARALDRYKTPLIRMMLEEIKRQDLEECFNIYYAASNLIKMGVKWTELPIIHTAAQVAARDWLTI